MAIEIWEPFFKPEVRSAGQAFVSKGQVALMRPTDTELVAYIRTSSSFKVQFSSPSMDSVVVTATCTCPNSKKGQLCKHIWATLVVVEEKNPDFFEAKTELLTTADDTHSNEASSNESSGGTGRPPLSQRQADSQAAYKLRQADSQAAYKLKQADYRKKQYQLQKERSQKIKKPKTSKFQVKPEFPSDVEEALIYFSENGFVLRDCLTAESVGGARKKLARVFHPDLGGSHDEIVELNRFTEVLMAFTDN